MKIALFIHSFAGGGAQRRTLTLAEGFAARGHHVDLVVVRATGPLRTEHPDGVGLVELDGRLPRLPLLHSRRGLQVRASIPALAAWLRRQRPDLLLSGANHVNLAAVRAHRAARLADTALVLRASNHLSTVAFNAQRRPRPLLKAAVRRLYPHADAIIAVSEDVAADVRRILNGAADRLQVIPNPVITIGIAAKAAAAPDHPWLAPGEPPVVLAVGRLAPQKDMPTLLRAFAALRRQREARLVILGEGPERPRLEALVRTLELGDAVSMPGFVANPFAFMARASLLVLASAWEGSPSVLVEAMFCGCPVVSTDSPGGAREILEGGALGRLVPVGDAAALAAAIGATLDAPPDRERLRARAAAFSAEAAADRYLAVLDAAVRARRERRAGAPSHASAIAARS